MTFYFTELNTADGVSLKNNLNRRIHDCSAQYSTSLRVITLARLIIKCKMKYNRNNRDKNTIKLLEKGRFESAIQH